MDMQGNAGETSVGEVRHAVLELHKRLIEAQRIRYERAHGRVQTPNQLLGLVLEHPDFEWIRALSALVAQLDEWCEARAQAGERQLAEILEALRGLLHPAGPNARFSHNYWQMVEHNPDVLIEHVKLTRVLGPSAPGQPSGA